MMMHTTRRAVYQKKVEHKIRIDIGLSKEFMNGTDWPWKFLWSEVEKQLRDLEILLLKKRLESLKGHDSRQDSLQSKEWERGIDYISSEKDRKARRRAKNAVIAEIEKGTKKSLTKTETVLSDVMFDLSNHGLDESAVSSSPRSVWTEQIIDSATSVINSLSRSASIAAIRLLTGRVA